MQEKRSFASTRLRVSCFHPSAMLFFSLSAGSIVFLFTCERSGLAARLKRQAEQLGYQLIPIENKSPVSR